LSPDPCLTPYREDFKWLSQVYESVKPISGNGRLLWHRLGAKTIDLINENVHIEAVRDDIEALVLDAALGAAMAVLFGNTEGFSGFTIL
jgi:type I restriction enzyme R subunit